MAAIGMGRYTLLSMLAASVVVYHAFATREYFYPATVYLSTSKIAVAVLGNLLFATAMCAHRILIKVFFGSLRDLEVEMIRERLSSAVMESLLALTIFREEFGSFFIAMFATLVFVKVMHWLVQDRVDYVEITPSVSLLQHLRLVSFMATLLLVDVLFLQYTIQGTIQSNGQSVMLLFAFEYVIQASNVIRYALKYFMSIIDMSLEGRWESKSIYVFYLELVTDLLHLFVYCIFFLLVYSNYGLPLHLVRDLYSTFRNFRNRIVDFLRFRAVTARLDRFPDASAEDLQRSDGVCIICREEMSAAGANKKLGCGHVFHLHCLRSWLERQQNCPTCRASVFRRPDPPPVAAAPPAPEQPGAAPVGGAAAVGGQAAAAGAPAQAAAAAPASGARAPAAPGPGGAAAAPAGGSPHAPAQGGQAGPHQHQHPHHFHVPNLQQPHRVRLPTHPAAAAGAARQGAAAAAGAPGQPGFAPHPPQGWAAFPPHAAAAHQGGAFGGFPPAGLHPSMWHSFAGAGAPMAMWLPVPPMPGQATPGPTPAPIPSQAGVPPGFIPVHMPFMLPGFPGMMPTGAGVPLETQVAALAAHAAWAATAAVHAPATGMMYMGPTGPANAAPAAPGAGVSAAGGSAAAAAAAVQDPAAAGLEFVERQAQAVQQQLDWLKEKLEYARRKQASVASAAAAGASSSNSSGTAAAAGPSPTAVSDASEGAASSSSAPVASFSVVPGEAQQAGPSADAASVAAAPAAATAPVAPAAAAVAAAAPAAPAAAAPVEQASDVAVTSQSSMAESDEGSDEQAEVRRRRLQRFEQAAGQQ